MSDDTLLNRFYQHVADADLLGRDAEVKLAIAGGVCALSAGRESGHAAVRVVNPTQAEDGWTTRHTVVQICTDDMPFLVDSVLGELQRQDLSVHLLVHPQIVVRREGDQVEVLDEDATAATADVESWMHLEVDRITGAQDREGLRDRLGSVLEDVRKACDDWPAMRERCREIIAGLEQGVPSTVDPETV
ncbi:MAG: NAD-glutamate dehydrogenase, partial [Actinomycetota bacterium]|nr:NAD-glutamate dehydrogenase [Actinomycetota bacterium]